jgi:hypothetical protein
MTIGRNMERDTILSPAGHALILERGLGGLDIEVRLSVAWPPTSRDVRADDFPEPIGGGYRRNLVRRDEWEFRADEGRAVGPLVEFKFSASLDDPRSDVVANVYVDRASGQLLWASRLDWPVRWRGPGTLEVLPEMGLTRPDDW